MPLGVSITHFEVGFEGGFIWKCVDCGQNNSYKSACTLCDRLADRSLIDKTHFFAFCTRQVGVDGGTDDERSDEDVAETTKACSTLPLRRTGSFN